jgi:hypothetical protein
MPQNNPYQRALDDQGFADPTSESPIDAPDPWVNGEVYQTGGFIMVRKWHRGGDWYWGDDEIDGEYAYECAYGQDPSVSIMRYTPDDEYGVMFDGEVIVETVDENTDEVKAQKAKELMERFENGEFDG